MLYHSKRKREKAIEKRLAARYDLYGRPTPLEKTSRLLRVSPEWGPILRECVVVSKERSVDDKFAGAWIVQGLHAKGITPPNNLRTLSGIGLLKRMDTTRGGNRAYYTIPHPNDINIALKKFGY